MSQRFIVLCEELATLQLQLLRREAAPKKLAKEGLNLIKENLDCLTPSSVNKAVVPLYLRSCASLLKHVPDRDELAVLDVLDETFAVAKEYIHSKRNESPNDDCSVLRSIMSIDECYANFSAKNSPSSSHDESKAVGSQFSELVVPVYDRGMRNLRSHPDSVSTQSMLTLMQGTSKVYGNNIKFVPTTADISSLLPIKPKIQMEAKIQRCYGARDLLNRLCQRELSRLDAGMCLSVMAETGFYDGDVCNLCCSALHTSHPLLTSPQLCQIIHSLGILQHRHIHQKFFSSLIDPKKCTADGLKKHVQGLAMLRQPPFSETKLMNGVFLHSLRNAHSPHHQGSTATKGPKPHLRYNEAVVDYELPPLWYIDVGHSLSVLDITHHKFKLSVARQARRSIAKLSTLERCKLLYAVGGAPLESVPTELRAAWENKWARLSTSRRRNSRRLSRWMGRR
ncbi:hypothetical protein AGDE_09427 [Angomonas deanei]|uniref:Uncharacterized protein n=1 Tax=Angomonas deanei TaxID=59799 RepID=A0A7G2C0G6_9TRYP|nr:hypothetical protein AGDE_09427 [Angomonas deanei]CAD2213179.1 hypothetical protein, conserved [Angomonas deanei]|eukprot:EPY30471.1 hypothetical protein AGDE_09427 [Angomonas deanei]